MPNISFCAQGYVESRDFIWYQKYVILHVQLQGQNKLQIFCMATLTLTDYLKAKTFWSNSEKKQIIITFKKCFTFSRKLTS